jgi:hypothetical protein
MWCFSLFPQYKFRLVPNYRGQVYQGYTRPLQASPEDDPVPDGFGVFVPTKATAQQFTDDSTSEIPDGSYLDPWVDPWRVRPDLDFVMTFSRTPR